MSLSAFRYCATSSTIFGLSGSFEAKISAEIEKHLASAQSLLEPDRRVVAALLDEVDVVL